MPVVYTSATLSLAALEFLVHLAPDEAPENLVSVAAEIADGVVIEHLRVASLPAGWRRYPAPVALSRIGHAWTTDGRSAVLAVPSAVIPDETNYLLNPRHREFQRIRINVPYGSRFTSERLFRPET